MKRIIISLVAIGILLAPTTSSAMLKMVVPYSPQWQSAVESYQKKLNEESQQKQATKKIETPSVKVAPTVQTPTPVTPQTVTKSTTNTIATSTNTNTKSVEQAVDLQAQLDSLLKQILLLQEQIRALTAQTR